MRRFFTELGTLRDELVEMASLVKSSIHKSVLCLTERNPDYADQVFRNEAVVNRAEINIDDLATKLVTLDQPVASDMRLIVAALKINTDLERMGDLAAHIARRALSLIQSPPLEPELPLTRLSDLVESMVERAIKSFVDSDADLARNILPADDEVDQLRNQIEDDLTQRMEAQPQLVRRILEYLFVVRNLERISDHATNIAEDVIYLVRGVDVRHRKEADATVEG